MLADNFIVEFLSTCPPPPPLPFISHSVTYLNTYNPWFLGHVILNFLDTRLASHAIYVKLCYFLHFFFTYNIKDITQLLLIHEQARHSYGSLANLYHLTATIHTFLSAIKLYAVGSFIFTQSKLSLM